MKPEFHIGQRVRFRGSMFSPPRDGVIAKIEPNHDNSFLLYWLTDGGLFSAYELIAA